MNYYTTKDNLLYSVLNGNIDTEMLRKEGYTVHEGYPIGFDPTKMPADHRWHVKEQRWVDTRTPEQINEDIQNNVLVMRRNAYPDLAELADAMFWNAQGDSTKLDAYYAKCKAVKEQYPKDIAI